MEKQQPDAYNRSNEGTRIPLSLQAVFLSGNRGQEVNTPPPDASAMKLFTVHHNNAQGSSRWPPFRSWSSIASFSRNTVAPASASTEKDTKMSFVRKVKRSKSAPQPSLSPQDYLEGLMLSRGYSTSKYATLVSGYYNTPTQLQLASYGVYVLGILRDGNTEAVQEVLNLGLSSNACNLHGESIVHKVCRQSDILMLDVLLQAKCDVRVSDENGRTPLHFACWATEPNFPLIEKILERDKQMLFMMDSRGHLPLSYILKHHWSQWLQFLQSKKDDYWPRGGSTSRNIEAPGLPLSEPNSRPIRDPDVTLTIPLIQMVTSGKLNPKEAKFMQTEFESEENTLSSRMNGDDDTDCSGESDDASVGSIVSESSTAKQEFNDSWNYEEMNEILNSLAKPNRAPLPW